MNDSNAPSSALIETIGRLHPFSELDAGALAELKQLMRLPSFGLCTCEQTAAGLDPMPVINGHRHTVYLTRGELKLVYADDRSRVIAAGSDEAASPLARGDDHPVSVTALTELELLCFDEAKLDTVLTWQQMAAPATGPTAEPHADWRMTTGVFAANSLAVDAFAALPPASIEKLQQRFEKLAVKAGDVIIRQGEPGDYFYLIDSGRCAVTRNVDGVDTPLAELGAGDTFGEEALISDSTRNATVTMIGDGMLRRLAKEDFLELLQAPLLHTVTPEEALDRVTKGALWLDVRFPSEYQFDGLPGADNIPLNEIRREARALDAGRDYIVYCYSGQRSLAAAFLLSQRGFRVSQLQGGLKTFVKLMSTNKFRVATRSVLW